jgi:PAS domain S-box-containing protein
VGICHLDAQGRYLQVNEKLREILGRPCEELRGRSFLELTHPDDREPDAPWHAALWRAELDSYAVQKRYVRNDGQAVWPLVTWSLQRDEAGRSMYAIAIVQDISRPIHDASGQIVRWFGVAANISTSSRPSTRSVGDWPRFCTTTCSSCWSAPSLPGSGGRLPQVRHTERDQMHRSGGMISARGQRAGMAHSIRRTTCC